MNATANALDLIAAVLGLSPRFVAAWALAEQGRKILAGPPPDNNWMNISPDGVIASYPDTAAYAEAMRSLLVGPNDLGFTLADLQHAATDEDRASIVAASAWASSHYYRTATNPGGTIWGCYNTGAYEPLFAALVNAPVEQAAETIITATGQGTPDEVLSAPEDASIPAAPVSISVQHPTYTVKSGDNLWLLCRGNWTLINEVKALNHIGSDNKIDIGQILTMPVGWTLGG